MSPSAWQYPQLSEHVGTGSGAFTGMGFRCVPLQLYTYTHRFQRPDGSVELLSQEGYFHSLYEAWCAAAIKLAHHVLVGVRPGGLVLPPALKERLKDASRENLWQLQRILISRVAFGLFTLGEIINRDAARRALLAGGGVVVSGWWFLSGRSRRELLALMHHGSVQQALRVEMMQALVVLQSIHSRSHPLFDGDGAGRAAAAV